MTEEDQDLIWSSGCYINGKEWSIDEHGNVSYRYSPDHDAYDDGEWKLHEMISVTDFQAWRKGKQDNPLLALQYIEYLFT